MRIGIPRALFYYNYYPLWKTFCETLGVECVVSSPTHKRTLESGAARVTGETCLPVKIYCGHVLALAGQVDYVLVPLIRQLGRDEENCPRLLGLPDLVRAVIPESPPLLSPEIDVSKGLRNVAAAIFELGRRFTHNPLRLREAIDTALAVQKRYEYKLRRGSTAPAAIEQLERSGLETHPRPTDGGFRPTRLTIALLGHPYNLYDAYVNHGLLRRLQALGLAVLTSDAVPADEIRPFAERHQGRAYWTYEHELAGAAAYYLSTGQVDGLIAAAAFGCGPDAVMLETVQELARRHGKPMLNLILDEHTGEAGLITRIEAFADMLERKLSRRGA